MKKLVLFFLIISFTYSCSEDVITYNLTLSSNPPEGGIASSSKQEYESGETASIVAVPSEEYLFDRWSGSSNSLSSSTSVIMDSDKSLVANFIKKQYTLTINVIGEGEVNKNIIKQGVVDVSTHNSGTIIELNASPSNEWEFLEWQGDLTGADNPKQITINEPKTVTAVFVKKKYPLTIEIVGDGSVSQTVIKQGLATDYNSGSIIQLEAKGNTGWGFVEWQRDLSGSENPKQITIDSPKIVKAIFGETIYLPDDNFENYLIQNGYDDILDDYVVKANVVNIESLNLTSQNIQSAVGIEHFESLKELNLSRNKLSSIDLGNNTNLKYIHLGDNQISSLDLSNNVLLEELYINYNDDSSQYINKLDLSNNTSLKKLNLRDSFIKELNITGLTLLETLELGHWHSAWLDPGNGIYDLDLSTNINLKSLSWSQASSLHSLDLSNNVNLEHLTISYARISSIDLSKNVNLQDINLSMLGVDEIDLTKNTSLEKFRSINWNTYNQGARVIHFPDSENFKTIEYRQGRHVEMNFPENSNVEKLQLIEVGYWFLQLLNDLDKVKEIEFDQWLSYYFYFPNSVLDLKKFNLEKLEITDRQQGLQCVEVNATTKSYLENNNTFGGNGVTLSLDCN